VLEYAILIRAAHYVTLFVAAGALAFSAFVAVPSFAGMGTPAVFERAGRRQHRLVIAAGLGALVTAVLWLVVETQSMSGRPLEAALSPALLVQVLRGTSFGQIWILRLALLAMLVLVTILPPARWREIAGAGLGLAAAATLAFAGHAAAANLWSRAADMLHLVLAALWIGSLPPLADLLRAAARGPAEASEIMARCCRRFSVLGMICVTGLLGTGIVNAWSLVGSLPAFIGTAYGRLLAVKITLFLGMIAFAAVNRGSLTPALEETGAAAQHAARRLARNALLELALGALILLDVGALGISVPAAHDQILWPLPVTWSLDVVVGDPMKQGIALAASVLALVGIGAAFRAASALNHPVRWLAGGGALTAGAALVAGVTLSEAAVPTFYLNSPLPYSVGTVAAGARVFADQCARCHGPMGYGDGPAAKSLPVKPADLARQHVGHHTDGTLFWWVSHGKGENAMPAFADALDAPARWQALAFLHATHDAETARAQGPIPDPALRAPAPDFWFERGGNAQQSLSALRGSWAVLLVFYTLPDSQARLDALMRAEQRLSLAGLRVIAVPLGEASATGRIFAPADPELASVYRLFERGGMDVSRTHREFFIDHWGYLRARWLANDGPDPEKLLAMLDAIDREPEPPPPSSSGHSH